LFEPLGAALILSTATPDAPECWELQPGDPMTSEMVGWYNKEGAHVLDVPHTWTIDRTYQELVSYGLCNQPEFNTKNIIEEKSDKVFNTLPIVVPPTFPLEVTDWVLQRSIGRAEGTRDRNGNPNQAWYGHNDPGWQGKCQNIGSFSYQHCANNPEEADQKWLGVLRNTAEPLIQNRAKERFGIPLSSAALVVGLDAWTQSPDAGRRYVKHLPSPDPSPEQLIAARVAALNESRGAIGGPAWFKVEPDQERRVKAILGQLEILHNEQNEAERQKLLEQLEQNK